MAKAEQRRKQAAEPRRTCIGCGRVGTPDELLRLARPPGGALSVGRSLHGRGAWLCRGEGAPVSDVCFEAAVRRRAFDRALRTEIPHGEIDAVRARLLGPT